MKTVLHVGCGDSPLPEGLFPDYREIRADINPECRRDLHLDMAHAWSPHTPWLFEAPHDAVFCSHALEHLPYHKIPVALDNFRIALRPQGHLVLMVPDLQTVAMSMIRGDLEEELYQSEAGPVCAIDVLYGYRKFLAGGKEHQHHRTGFTKLTMERALWKAGFKEVSTMTDGWNLCAKAVKP